MAGGGKAFVCAAAGRRSAAAWEEDTVVYPVFNFLQHLPGHLISSKRLDFPLALLATAGPDPPRWHGITRAVSLHAPVWTTGKRSREPCADRQTPA